MRRALLASVLLLASCEASPTTPAPLPVPPTLPVSVTPGPYTLTLTLALSGQPTCSNGICTSVTLCVGNPDATSALFDVEVARAGSDVDIAAADGATTVVMRLNTAAAPATGSMAINGRDRRGIMVNASGTLTGTGAASPAIAAVGGFDGQLTMGGGGCSNNGHTWTLAPR